MTNPMTSPDVVELGAAALFGVSDFEGSWADLSEMSKQIYREKAHAVLLASIPLVETQAGNTAIVDKLESALVRARECLIDEDRSVAYIDEALATLRTNRGGGQ